MKTNLSVYLSKRQTYKYTIHNFIAVKEVRKMKDGIIIAHAQYVSVCQKRKKWIRGKKDKKERERKNKGKTRETKEVFSITDAINMSFSIVIIF